MKKFLTLRQIAAILLTIMTVFMGTACKLNAGFNDETTNGNDTFVTEESTSVIDSNTTDSETTVQDESHPNEEPKIKYTVTETTVDVKGLDISKKGSVMNTDDEGVKTIFSADYEDGDKTVGSKAGYRDSDLAAIIDGQLYFPHDGAEFKRKWTTWSPLTGTSIKDYHQVQLSLDMKSFRPANNEEVNSWTSTFIGCYVSNYSNTIPNSPGDGLWFTFAPENEITVLGGNTDSWPAGFAKVKIPQGFYDMHHLDIICTEDYSTYIYATYNGEESQLLLKVEMSETELSVYDCNGDLVNKTANQRSNCSGDYFSVFVHNGGGCVMDNVKILAGEKETKKVIKEITAIPEEGAVLGLDMTNKNDLVSICYSVWFDGILGTGDEPVTDFNNITEVLEGKREWGGETAFHYWAKPAQGYYRSTDKQAIRNNMKLLGDANVDFIILDYTNANDGYVTNTSLGKVMAFSPLEALCDTIMEMRAEGQKTPYVVLWCGKSDGPLIEAFYEKFYTVEKWRDCFVYWDNKPFIITATSEPFPCEDKFTVRYMWGLTNEKCWRFLNINNKGTTYRNNDVKEQLSVAVASQETYMSKPTAHGRNHGLFFYNQWKEAFKIHPKVITLTWWNEWCAQRFIVDGETAFVDNYNQEYSRDIEPMDGGHGDTYYKWMKEYIAAYKSGGTCPKLVEEGY